MRCLQLQPVDLEELQKLLGQKIMKRPVQVFANEALEFFKSIDFNQDTVYMLKRATANALKMHVCIYQHKHGEMQVIKIGSGYYILCKEVHLKFSGSMKVHCYPL